MTKMIFHAFGVLRLESCSNFLERIHLLQLLTITTTLATAQQRFTPIGQLWPTRLQLGLTPHFFTNQFLTRN